MRVVWLLVVMAFLACVASLSLEERQKTLSEVPDKINLGMRVEREAKEGKSGNPNPKPEIQIKKPNGKKAGTKNKRTRNTKQGSVKPKIQKKVKKSPQKEGRKQKNLKKVKTKPINKKIKKLKKAKMGSRKQKKEYGSTVQKKVQRQGQCDDCLVTAQNVLLFEGYNVKNFLKQYTRYSTLQKVVGNKLAKKAQFEPAAAKMTSAVSDANNMTCSESSAAALYRGVLEKLTNCSNEVTAACDKPLTGIAVTSMEECMVLMSAVKDPVEACMKMDADAATACRCWTDVSTNNMAPIKDLQCNALMTIMVRAMVANRNDCKEPFGVCKKMEDAAPGLVYSCMDVGDTREWNQFEDVKIVVKAGGLSEF